MTYAEEMQLRAAERQRAEAVRAVVRAAARDPLVVALYDQYYRLYRSNGYLSGKAFERLDQETGTWKLLIDTSHLPDYNLVDLVRAFSQLLP